MNQSRSANIYIHFPFCLRKCGYCDFYSVTGDMDDMTAYLEALERELSGPVFTASPETGIRSVYIGGGTPSLMPAPLLQKLFVILRERFAIRNVEITLEANPRPGLTGLLPLMKNLGINRLSLGIQSLSGRELAFLGRDHTVEDAIRAVHSARSAGFENLGADLIFGLPGQSLKTWERTLDGILDLPLTHISAYALTWHAHSPLGRSLARGEIKPLSDDRTADQFLLAHDRLEKKGFEHYEVSSFARPGFRCRHNEDCWTGVPYRGYGPSAHSFDGLRRFWNVSDAREYHSRLMTGLTAVAGQETISPARRRLERLALGLRRKEGIPLETVKTAPDFKEWITMGLIRIHEGRLMLTSRGLLLADELTLQLAG